MTQLERNGDLVVMASYAPLLAKNGRTQWRPDLIYFDNTHLYPTINYHVQKLFGVHAGDKLLSAIQTDDAGLFVSAVLDSNSGDAIVKVVNPSDKPKSLRLDLTPLPYPAGEAKVWTLSGDPDATNPTSARTNDDDPVLEPVESTMAIDETTELTAPAYSLEVIRFASGG